MKQETKRKPRKPNAINLPLSYSNPWVLIRKKTKNQKTPSNSSLKMRNYLSRSLNKTKNNQNIEHKDW